MRRAAVLFAAASIACAAAGETVLFDFETEAEQKAIVKADRSKAFHVAVTNGLATSGEHALVFSCDRWREGAPRYPAVRLASPFADWRGYKRLAIDLVCIGGDDDALGVGLTSPGVSVRKGPRYSIPLPKGGGYVQCILPLDRWTAGVRPENVSEIQFTADHPSGYTVVIDRITLLEKGESPSSPRGPQIGRDLLSFEATLRGKARQRDDDLEREHIHALARDRFCRDLWRTPETLHSDALLLGWATSMEKIFPRGDFTVRPLTVDGLSVRLAGNECESVQLVVTPVDAEDGLRQVRVVPEGDLASGNGSVFVASNVDCDVVGYVNVTSRPPYRVARTVKAEKPPFYERLTERPYAGWTPDPILDFLDGVDVAGTDVQCFWIRVKCPENQKAGIYKGALIVSADGIVPVRVPFSVRVNNFALGRTSALPLAVSFSPSASGKTLGNAAKILTADPLFPGNLWKKHNDAWVDFLADYLISYDALYHESDLERLDALKRLRAQDRLGLFNIGVFNCPAKGSPIGEWRARTLPRLVQFYEAAKALGIEKQAYVYGCDEAKSELLPQVRLATGEIKRALPDVKVITTARDADYGVGSPLDVVDWFCPLSETYDLAKANRARQAGHKVWWYICCDPRAPYANMFVECSAIEGRILMGAQAVKYRPDGFLYYSIASWCSRRCITSGPFTDWNPRSHGPFNGDGSWVCAGPDGKPLPTIRLENFRDGLEDYAYARLLGERLCAVESGKCIVKKGDGKEWIRRVREVLAVPREIVDTMKNFTGEPEALYSWRDAMADLIESAGK